MMRHPQWIAALFTATALVGGVGTAATADAPATGPQRPSACRPANHLAKITADRPSSGHRHYRVTLEAPRGYAPCRLAGSPTDVRFYRAGSPERITTRPYGPQHETVVFGPGRPVHFDIQVPFSRRSARADEARFTLKAPGGVIPGESSASGRVEVVRGTQIGPVRPGR
ncbi:hypothetical protein GTW43_16325 [Streptomyces sp. SID5785]|uniref:hypothetical protein n=1 Tax=Streptomyces sp. SID5785 TaxID=2690309 RepID=UPI001361A3A9|nr:hypothetical protein [Streptomyces sp. SID5785]MZD06651.1 hypothetical protein [Streptomyces sp. SID5785]